MCNAEWYRPGVPGGTVMSAGGTKGVGVGGVGGNATFDAAVAAAAVVDEGVQAQMRSSTRCTKVVVVPVGTVLDETST